MTNWRNTGRRITIVVGFVLLLFIVFKYILGQINLINTSRWTVWSTILFLLAISFVVGGFETAISSIDDNEIFVWQEKIRSDWKEIHRYLARSEFNIIRPIRLLARAMYVIQEIRVRPFTDYISSPHRPEGSIPSINVQKCIAFCLAIGVLLDVNVTVLFGISVYNADIFQDGVLASWIPGATFINKYLPLPGSSGLTSVGVSLIALIFIEIIPKRLAYNNSMAFLKAGSWLVGILYCSYIPAILSQCVEIVADACIGAIRKIMGLGGMFP
jgi:hypothetical protein